MINKQLKKTKSKKENQKRETKKRKSPRHYDEVIG